MSRHSSNGTRYLWPVYALVRAGILTLFWFVARAWFRVEYHGLNRLRRQPGTYLAMAHKRDLDSVVPVHRIVRRLGWRAMGGRVHFSMRADAHSPGFLSRMVMRPRWFSRLLRPISLGPLLRRIGTHPLEGLQRPAEEWLREAIHATRNAPIGQALTPVYIAAIAKQAGDDPGQLAQQRLRHLLRWRYQQCLQVFVGVDIFQDALHKVMTERVLQTIHYQLADIAGWLKRGGIMYGSPEGHLSTDGRLSAITSGLHRVLHDTPPRTRITPIFTIYDFMTTRRMGIFVDIAETIEMAPTLAPHALDDALYRAWRAAARFTTTQLASGYLINAYRYHAATIRLDDLVDHLTLQAATLREAGRQVDKRLLNPRQAKQLASSYLAYATKRGYLRRLDAQTWAIALTDMDLLIPPGAIPHHAAPLAYAWNEYQDMLHMPEEHNAPQMPRLAAVRVYAQSRSQPTMRISN